MGSEELKSCPFCGQDNNNHSNHCYFMVVSKADTYDRQYPHVNFKKPSKEDIVNAWNNRPHENKIKAEAVRELKEYLYDEASYLNEIGELMDDYADKLEQGEL